MKTLIAAAILALSASAASATDYRLHRALVTWSDGVTHDSHLGDFSVSGTMNITGNRILQSVTVCLETCGSAQAEATIVSVAKGAARVRLRNINGVVEDMTLLSLWPNIITMSTYHDGTVEIAEWSTVQGFVRNETPDEGLDVREASVGKLVK